MRPVHLGLADPRPSLPALDFLTGIGGCNAERAPIRLPRRILVRR
jgi:hypothetical protein